jgi:predicted ATPase
MTPLPDSEPYRLPVPACLIRRVRIRNYKSIRHADVSLSPFTILVGRNGSGKSNFLDALHFVADSLQISLEHATESRGGVDSVFRRTKDEATSLSVEIELSLPSGKTAEYRFVLLSRNRRFVVQHEVLRVRSSGQGRSDVDHYAIREGTIKSASIQALPFANEDRLYLTKASGFDPFREVYDALTAMGFYNLNPDAMRAPQAPSSGEILHRDGANIASVAKRLREQQPEEMARLDLYLAAIVPELVGVETESLGPYETLAFWQRLAGEKLPAKFFAANMSDGTLRVTGILVAVAQLSEQQKSITLIGVEEPETALHPAATRALMDALRDASVQAQVLVTTHSSDLLDQVEMDHESLLAVMSQDGITHIAPLDDASLEVIRDSLFTPGELLRLDQLEPNLKDLARQEQTLASWSEEDDAPVADRSDRRRPR